MAPTSRFGAVGQFLRSGGRSSLHKGSFTGRRVAGVAARIASQPSAYLRVTLASYQARCITTGGGVEPAKRDKPGSNEIRPKKLMPFSGEFMSGKELETVGNLSGVEIPKGDKSSNLILRYENETRPIPVSRLWLRDSCDCEHCVTPSSGQKRFRTSDLPDRPAVESANVADDGTLSVVWAGEVTESGAPHVSTFTSESLLKSLAHRVAPFTPALPQRRMWNRTNIERELRPVAFADWVAGNEEFWRGLMDLYQRGLLIVDGVPQDDTGVLQVANAIGHVQTTFYGETFDVISKPQAENVAYTNVFLCLHQDLMYMNDPPYIQLLHCLHNECDGGESLFSDSIRAAWEMVLKYPAEAEVLARQYVPYHYERQGHYYFNNRRVFEMSRHGKYIENTAWSPPFQNEFRPPSIYFGHDGHSKVAAHFSKWRKAAKIFSDMIESPENQYEVKMKPGQCVLFNNRRSLHGRNQFNTSQGSRHLKGTYISEQVFLSKVMAMVRENKYAPASTTPTTPMTNRDRRTHEMNEVRQLLEEKEGASQEAPTD